MLPLVYRGAWLAGAVLLVLGIAYGSLTSAPFVAAVSGLDKLEHATAYLLLTLWLTGILERRRYWVAASVSLLLGAGLELAQGALTTVRVADPGDMVANATGVGIALVLAHVALGGWAARVERWLGARAPGA